MNVKIKINRKEMVRKEVSVKIFCEDIVFLDIII